MMYWKCGSDGESKMKYTEGTHTTRLEGLDVLLTCISAGYLYKCKANRKCYPVADIPAVSLIWVILSSLLGDTTFSFCVWQSGALIPDENLNYNSYTYSS